MNTNESNLVLEYLSGKRRGCSIFFSCSSTVSSQQQQQQQQGLNGIEIMMKGMSVSVFVSFFFSFFISYFSLRFYTTHIVFCSVTLQNTSSSAWICVSQWRKHARFSNRMDRFRFIFFVGSSWVDHHHGLSRKSQRTRRGLKEGITLVIRKKFTYYQRKWERSTKIGCKTHWIWTGFGWWCSNFHLIDIIYVSWIMLNLFIIRIKSYSGRSDFVNLLLWILRVFCCSKFLICSAI